MELDNGRASIDEFILVFQMMFRAAQARHDLLSESKHFFPPFWPISVENHVYHVLTAPSGIILRPFSIVWYYITFIMCFNVDLLTHTTSEVTRIMTLMFVNVSKAQTRETLLWALTTDPLNFQVHDSEQMALLSRVCRLESTLSPTLQQRLERSLLSFLLHDCERNWDDSAFEVAQIISDIRRELV